MDRITGHESLRHKVLVRLACERPCDITSASACIGCGRHSVVVVVIVEVEFDISVEYDAGGGRVSIGDMACHGYARTCAGRCDLTKVHSASQSSVIHLSMFSVSSLGQIQVVVVIRVERLYQSEERIHRSVSEDSPQQKGHMHLDQTRGILHVHKFQRCERGCPTQKPHQLQLAEKRRLNSQMLQWQRR